MRSNTNDGHDIHRNSHRGNKSFLPSKPCATCGRPMTWRRRWATTWAEVKHCSDACRRQRAR